MSFFNLPIFSRSRYAQLVLYKAYADLMSEVDRYFIGYVWWVVEPVLDMTIYYIVFGLFLNRGTPDYVPFLLLGLVSWRWMSTSLMLGANSILVSRPLMNQVYLPKIIFPTVAFVTNSFKFAITFVLLLAFLWIYGYEPTLAYAALPAILLTELLFILAITYIFAALVPFFSDLRIILDSSLRVVFFASGVFFPGASLTEEHQFFFYLNPMANIIEDFRKVLMHNQWPDLRSLAIIAAASLPGIFLGAYLIMRNDYRYPKAI